jgi:hypothetical protein
MKAITLTLAALVALGGCGTKRINNYAFEGEFYQTRTQSSRADRKAFVATARPLSKGLEGARQAAAFEGTKHCLDYYGTSLIDWATGPDTDDEALEIEGDTLVYRGRCVER